MDQFRRAGKFDEETVMFSRGPVTETSRVASPSTDKSLDPQVAHTNIFVFSAHGRKEQGALEPAVQIPSSRPSSTLVAYGVSRAQSSGSSCQSDGDFGFNETRLDLKALPVKRSAYFSRNAAQYIDSEDVLPEDDHNWENRMDKEQNLRQQLQVRHFAGFLKVFMPPLLTAIPTLLTFVELIFCCL